MSTDRTPSEEHETELEPSPELPSSESTSEFESFLEYLRRNRGFDFTGYKRPSLIRRVERRMGVLEIDSFASYVDYLEVHPDEFAHLFNTILINVTAFFRDAPAWDLLVNQVIPPLLASKSPDSPIRIWSAGCASGEEAYTLAIVFAEALGLEEFKKRVKIYATDIDEHALAEARQATYTHRGIAGVPPELVERYFEPQGTNFVVNKDLRRGVIFGRHDLIQDSPISRIDVLTCRNTLMYFNSETQTKILSRLHFALNEGGCFMLGKAEMLFTHGNIFIPLDLKRRIFSKRVRANPASRELYLAQADVRQEHRQMPDSGRIRDLAFERGVIAQIVVDVNGCLAMANERARSLFRLTTLDIARPLQDLEVSYRPVELRSMIEQVYVERRMAVVKDVAWPPGIGEDNFTDVSVTPLLDPRGELLGASVIYTDVTRYKRLEEELLDSNRELETAYEELQSTNEELETTNEELQSTVEELETTNEELQSTNEELETMNEELQSTNEELQTINAEMRDQSAELSRTKN